MDNLEQNKLKILECAREIVRTEGLSSLAVSKITGKCSISNRTFYEIFPSKNALIQQLKSEFSKASMDFPDERELILQKAWEGFSKLGYLGIDMDTIAKSAGTNRASIYKYFKTKEELMENCVAYEVELVKKTAGVLLANTGDPKAALEGYITGYCHYIGLNYNNTLFSEIYNQISHSEKLTAYIKDLHQFFMDAFRNTLEAGIKKGIFRQDLDTEGVAIVMLSAVNGLSFFAKVDPSLDITVKVRKSMLELMNNTILKQ